LKSIFSVKQKIVKSLQKKNEKFEIEKLKKPANLFLSLLSIAKHTDKLMNMKLRQIEYLILNII
jgi:hypothetical protein